MIKILGRHTSYNVQKVLWLAEELNLNYEHKEVGGRFRGTDLSEFKALNPQQKVPVIITSDGPIWESNTILRYLASTYDQDNWIAKDAYQRSICERWMDWCLVTLEPAFVGVFWNYFRTPVEQRNMTLVNDHIEKTERCLSLINDQIGDNTFFLGPSITLADICVGVFLFRLATLDIDIQFPKNMQTWYDTLVQRKGYQKWVMSDYSELEGRVTY